MKILPVKNNIMNSVTYVLHEEDVDYCVLIDCGEWETLKPVLEKIGKKVRAVLLTHAHTDHIYGINKLIETFPNALIYTNAEGEKGLQNPQWNLSRYHYDIEDFIISSPQNVRVIDKEGSLQVDDDIMVEVLFTPGHEPSCLSFIIENNLFTGDAYIPGIGTVVSFPRSYKISAQKTLKRLQYLEKKGLTVCAGHRIIK